MKAPMRSAWLLITLAWGALVLVTPRPVAAADAPAAPGTPQEKPASSGDKPAAPATLAELVRALEAPQVAEGAVPVEGLEFTTGHLKVTLGKGLAAIVRAAGEPVGLFFKGEGSYTYLSSDAVEAPVMTFNVKKGSALRYDAAGGGGKIVDTFSTALIRAAGRPLPELAGAESGSVAEPFTAHVELFAQDASAPAAHLFAVQKLDEPATAVTRVELSGGKEDVVHVLDPFLARSETFYVLRRSGIEDKEMHRRRDPVVLSDLPLGRTRRDIAPIRALLGDVDYTLVASGGRDATLSVVETFVPVEKPVRVLRLDLLNVTYDVVGAGKLDARHFRVKSVKDGAGRELSFHHENDEILVALGAPAPARAPVKVRFEIEGDFLIRPNGDNFWELGTEPWFPQPALGEQAYTVHSVVKVKKPFIAFAPGVTIGRSAEGDYNVVENRVDQPVQFAVVHAGKYELSEETRGGVTVRVASYAGRNERAWKQLTDLAYGIMEYYQNFLGPFPMPEFNIIEVNTFGYGQAPPGTMFITKEAFQSQLGEENKFYSKGVNERFAHEIAHQYWGIAVKMPSLEEQWITESFAEYSAAMFLRKYEGKATYDSLVATWKANAKEAREAAPIPLCNRIRVKDDAYRAFVLRTYLLYDKGAYLLSRIHAGMDDKTFMTFLKSYQKNFKWKFASTAHVEGLLQFLTNKDWKPWFDANYWGTGLPD